MKRKKNFILRTVGGEKILVPIGNEVFDLNGLITLNQTGAFVWELLSEEHTPEELSAAVAEAFNINADAALADMKIFLDEITKMGLLEE